MNRKEFLRLGTAVGAGMLLKNPVLARATFNRDKLHPVFRNLSYPQANAMWDFSWIERRYTGADYADWDLVLDELKERGYDAVRIDAFPHLVSIDPGKEWLLVPEWSVHDWGSPGNVKVQIQPNLNIFIEKCAERDLKVMLSTWWRKDKDESVKLINSPAKLARAWKYTLDTIKDAGLIENILFVDLCNEYPHPDWPKFLPENYKTDFSHKDYKPWMKDSIELLKNEYPQMPFTFSFFGDEWLKKDDSLPYLDLLEIHIWVANFSNFEQELNYTWEPHNNLEYNLIQEAESLYYAKEDYWKSKLMEGINFSIEASENMGLPIITTESWGPITYKDWPLLNWKWVKEICEFGVVEASKSGRWASMCTSNFCGPQFKGMWDDIKWHRKLTDIIHNSPMKF